MDWIMTYYILAYIACGVATRVLNLYTLCYIQQESDGGGWDSGSVYRFYPDLPYDHSLIGTSNSGWHGSNEREEGLIWMLSIMFWPILFLQWVIMFPFAVLFWWISKTPKGAWRQR